MTGVSSTRREKTPPLDFVTETQVLGEGLREQSPSPFEEEKDDLQWVEPAAAPPPLPPHSITTSSLELGETDNAPPVPPHGRTRDQRAEEERKKREREDTRREIERELVRRERDEEKIREQKAGVVPRRQAPKAPAVAPSRGVVLRMKHNRDRPAGVEEEGNVIGKPMGYKKLHPPPSHPAPSPPADEPVRDMADQQTALCGLPPSSELVCSQHSHTVPPPLQ